jgi:hypothetical protein
LSYDWLGGICYVACTYPTLTETLYSFLVRMGSLTLVHPLFTQVRRWQHASPAPVHPPVSQSPQIHAPTSLNPLSWRRVGRGVDMVRLMNLMISDVDTRLSGIVDSMCRVRCV